ncbi:MAG: 2-C-methyl-D-erythritol 2,4-cyclodiphosphate synthase [Clostridia bacterium]|nr:2-C-methyl-D-erythritol 2,4-cyclodiphosphate synthase [Clostridia bacterium]
MDIRIGHGFDVHAFAENRKLILCGVEIESDKGLLGHSDADVATHAVMDSLLGAAAQGDIGKHFPDTDEKYKGADSLKLMERVMEIIKLEGYSVSNIDITIIAQKPKLAPYIDKMAENIARVAGIEKSRVNVKATTTEKLGFTGRGEGIATEAVCLLTK